MMASFLAPELRQYDDGLFLIEIGQRLFDGAIRSIPNANGLRIWVDGTPQDPATRQRAGAIFQTALGALRAWCPIAGELADEARFGLGTGSVTDVAGSQWLTVGPANDYSAIEDKLSGFIDDLKVGVDSSQPFRNALWLNGRASRTSADLYMIHEYAKTEFGGTKAIALQLGLTEKSQNRLTQAANNLSPLLGGRHASEKAIPVMDLDDQRRYVNGLLASWARTYRASESS
jgi:hypothetical protein